ncbi:hypothetical protein CYMTET_26144 [Cymbomonas tetramitiformis]|uniref:Uncharacterized protein n=1 Tax=Cymbomonas tetramitiformis TaxID=36881 RepID=A0AAE0FSY7_9CHLO|nr:hypothetical protein CYMTET_26144 [Cymbomonas tetramitiformis]
MEMFLLSQKPRCDAAYAAQDKRLEELTDSLANRPDAPICATCKKPSHKLWCKGMCKPCYSKSRVVLAKETKKTGW